MENLVLNSEFWKGRRVLVTGHTGFKGAWLCLWLHQLGARVSGLSIDMVSEPNLWSLIELDEVSHHIGDVRDIARVQQVLNEEKPEVVFHLAAQSLVRRSYREPIETFSTNVMGVVALLSAIAKSDSVKAAVIVTSDKCYENREWIWGYRENEAMGGYDPYSSSKACAELVTSAYRQSFMESAGISVASARAGNVIGGGDWSEDRLIPDIIKGILNEEEIKIRNPNSIRPWQFILEPLYGYLLLIEKLAENSLEYDQSWNFGPDEKESKSVSFLIEKLSDEWGKEIKIKYESSDIHEGNVLMLNSDKARSKLGWQPKMGLELSVKWTARWYKKYQEGENMRKITEQQIDEYSLLD